MSKVAERPGAAHGSTLLEHGPSGEATISGLTPDEVQFLAHVKASGQLPKLMGLAKSFATGISLSEIEKSAIDQRDFVDSVTKQASTLRSQVDRCKALCEFSTASYLLRADAKTEKLETLRAAKARLEKKAATDEIELQRAKSKIFAELDKLQYPHVDLGDGQVDRRDKDSGMSPLLADGKFFDTLLDKLQALGWEITAESKNKSLAQAARHYANLEVMLSIVTCKRTLNLVLMEALERYPSTVPGPSKQPRVLETEISAVMEEIQSLWDEVVPVAHMAVEKAMLGPILQLEDAVRKSVRSQNAIISSYIGDCLSFMNERLEVLASRIGLVVHHHLAVSIIHEYLQASLIDEQVGSERMQTLAQSTTMTNRSRDQPTALQSYIRHSVQTYGGFPSQALDPLTPAAKKTSTLNSYVTERTIKDSSRFNNLHKLFESAVKTSLHEGGSINTDVLQCILAESLRTQGHRGSALQDEQTEESLEALAEEAKKIRKILSDLPLPEVQVNGELQPFIHTIVSAVNAHRTRNSNAKSQQKRLGGISIFDSPGFRMDEKVEHIIQRWSGPTEAHK